MSFIASIPDVFLKRSFVLLRRIRVKDFDVTVGVELGRSNCVEQRSEI